ncbi:MAG: dynamin family protein [Paracoccaceae bacterium]|jgi:hypothetical protein
MVKNARFLSAGNAAVAGQMEALSDLSKKLGQLAEVSDRRTATRVTALQARLDEFAAKVTFVGQVKAGKSALANVLSGQPGLLPSDVNPWTSVVTTLMINNRNPSDPNGEADVKARFTFFDQDEWDKLVIGGGRLGELAERAGSTDEVAAIQKQVEAMRAATEKRLGKHFQFLLGQSHSYGYVDTELVERYVCLGDAPEIQDANAKTGRFADVTKSAEIYLDVPEYAMPLQLCDTPGVNDTFLMREQITIRALRGSELCVVVLSAHQALTTSDMALLRIISNLDKRQIIIFVNRIDELQNPADQVPEIRDGIVRTLTQARIDGDVALVFGSAAWGEAALTGRVEDLPEDSLKALESFVDANHDFVCDTDDETTWKASGLPALLQAIGERVSEGSAQRLHQKISRSVRNLTHEARATLVASRTRATEPSAVPSFEGSDPKAAIDDIAQRFGQEIDKLIKDLSDDLHDRLDKAQAGFIKRATDSLIQHLQENGEQGTWSYDPAGLRVLQRAAYTNFARSVRSKVTKVFDEAAKNTEAVYQAVIGDGLDDFQIAAPLPPDVPPPVGLGRTIALDLHSNWWRSWWKKRRGIESFASDYVHLIKAEAQSMTEELESGQAQQVLEKIRMTYTSFASEQQENIMRLMQGETPAAPSPQVAATTPDDRLNRLGEILRDLGAEAA